jgi:hypothetical protein
MKPRVLLPRAAMTFTELATTSSVKAPLVEFWDAWAFAEMDAELALKRWWDASAGDRAAAYAGYQAAFERETQAAAALEAQIGLTTGVVQTH